MTPYPNFIPILRIHLSILHMYYINESKKKQNPTPDNWHSVNKLSLQVHSVQPSHHQPNPQIPAFRTPSTRASTLPSIVPKNSFFSSVVLHFSCLPRVVVVAAAAAAVLSKFRVCFDGEEISKPISSQRDFVEINCDFEREWKEFEDDKLLLWPWGYRAPKPATFLGLWGI